MNTQQIEEINLEIGTAFRKATAAAGFSDDGYTFSAVFYNQIEWFLENGWSHKKTLAHLLRINGLEKNAGPAR